jgi:O-acetyl-ADP-ribose deacetylase (regulator of RNase III)
MTKLSLLKGDITTLHTDAIVNAANSSLLGGGGVDGAIHRAAGPALLAECRLLNGCPTGEARITKGYDLPARYVIHTVGPVWHGGNKGEALLLSNAYHNSLLLAKEHNISTIAFPNISTGVYHFPKEQAAAIAVNTVSQFINQQPDLLKELIFVCFDEENYKLYETILASNINS